VIRLTERYVHSDPSRRDERKLVKHLDEELGRYLKDISAPASTASSARRAPS
jgi:hypothetical protein